MLPDVIVCVKPAEAVRGSLSFTADGLRLAPECRTVLPNEADTFALEQALRLREQGLIGSVTCLTAGPPEMEAMLSLCFAMGADRALRIDLPDDVRLDEAATGALLGAAISNLGVKLVVTAQRSDDGGSGIVPAAIARAIDGAYLSNVAVVRLEGERVEVERKLERGNRQVWSASLPVVVAVESGTILPRYVSVAALILAKRQAIETITLEVLSVDPGRLARLTELKGLAAPRRRPKKTAVAAPANTAVVGGRGRVPAMGSVGAAANLGAGASSGSGQSKDKKILTGAPEDLATAVVNLLIEREILSREGR
jgi:electron transfer flavoprotein beta subunit